MMENGTFFWKQFNIIFNSINIDDMFAPLVQADCYEVQHALGNDFITANKRWFRA